MNEPLVTAGDIARVTRCLTEGWVSSIGPYVPEFEQSWARACDRAHGVAVANGTVALELAVEALGIGPGDEVIVPSFTIVSCATAVLSVGATPVFVDADPRTWCLDLDQVVERITPRTRAVMPVHIYGHPVDMDGLLPIARAAGIHVIEDAAEAHGAECLVQRGTPTEHWARCGSFGALSSFSFYANKLITTGEGGMVLTDDDELAVRLQELRNLGSQPARRFIHESLGHNFRLTNPQAALALGQIERLTEIVAFKRRNASLYLAGLAGLAERGVIALPVEEPWARNVYWMFGFVLDDAVGFDAEELARRLRALGVETRPFFHGMHEQPALLRAGVAPGERLPVTERLSRRGLYLPSGMTLSESQIERACAAVNEVLA